jgi:NDP-sugar pyrophosphorylase family protein
MKIIIPLAGYGSRFLDAGYELPKPLIKIQDKSMIEVVLDNINMDGDYIFICRKDHMIKYDLNMFFQKLKPGCTVISIDHVTEGAANTVLLAKKYIDNDDELLIANSDQWVDWNSKHFLSFIHRKNADGCILTFYASNPKWSFVKLDNHDHVIELAEKKVISNIATTGIYYYKHGRFFVSAAENMIKKNIRINNEYYVAPTYNELILENKKILVYPVAEMCGLGTPEDLDVFLKQTKFKI